MVFVIFGMVKKLVSFGVVLGVFYLAFGITDYLLFFSAIQDKSTIFKTILGQIRASSLGDIDFEVYQQAHQVVGVIFFFGFVFIMIVLLLNLLIAVMGEAYEVSNYCNIRDFLISLFFNCVANMHCLFC